MSDTKKHPPVESEKQLSADQIAERQQEIAWSCFVGALVILVLFVVTGWLADRGDLDRFESMAYESLQTQLSPFGQVDLPVVVVDISAIPRDVNGATDRRQLLAVVSEIANAKPRAIGIDLDFSPQNGNWSVPSGFTTDPQFLTKCRSLSSQTPIYVGVYGTQYYPKGKRLGVRYADGSSQDFDDLAAAILYNEDDKLRIPRWIKVDGQERLDSMSTVLARDYSERSLITDDNSSPIGNWLTRSLMISPKDGESEVNAKSREVSHGTYCRYKSTLINFSKLREIRRETLLTVSATSAREFAKRFEDRIVILGRSDDAKDQFNVPGEDNVPGMYLHACTAYTIVKEPVLEFQNWVRPLLDLGLAFTLLLTGSGVRWRKHKGVSGVEWAGLRTSYHGHGVLICLIASGLLVRFAHVFWLDFLVICLGLLLHPHFEVFCEYLFPKWREARIWSLWPNNLHRQSSESEQENEELEVAKEEN